MYSTVLYQHVTTAHTVPDQPSRPLQLFSMEFSDDHRFLDCPDSQSSMDCRLDFPPVSLEG